MPTDMYGNPININRQDTTAGGVGMYQMPNGSWSPSATYHGLTQGPNGQWLGQGGVDFSQGAGGSALGPGLYGDLQDVGALPQGSGTYDIRQHGGANLAPGTGWLRDASGNLSFNQDVVNREAARQYQMPVWTPPPPTPAASTPAASSSPASVAPSTQENSMATAQGAGAGNSQGGYTGTIGGQSFVNGQLQGGGSGASGGVPVQAQPVMSGPGSYGQQQTPDRMGGRYGNYGQIRQTPQYLGGGDFRLVQQQGGHGQQLGGYGHNSTPSYRSNQQQQNPQGGSSSWGGGGSQGSQASGGQQPYGGWSQPQRFGSYGTQQQPVRRQPATPGTNSSF